MELANLITMLQRKQAEIEEQSRTRARPHFPATAQVYVDRRWYDVQTVEHLEFVDLDGTSHVIQLVLKEH